MKKPAALTAAILLFLSLKKGSGNVDYLTIDPTDARIIGKAVAVWQTKRESSPPPVTVIIKKEA